MKTYAKLKSVPGLCRTCVFHVHASCMAFRLGLCCLRGPVVYASTVPAVPGMLGRLLETRRTESMLNIDVRTLRKELRIWVR